MIEPRKKYAENDPFADKREEKALRNFKKVLKEMLRLLMRSTTSSTVSLHWVNHSRKQFVLECYGTTSSNTTFQDRIDFEQSYLDEYKSISKPVILEVGKDIEEKDLTHYYKEVPVKYVMILPFINNKETVGLTILETNLHTLNEDQEDAIDAYQHALGYLLYTFIELSDLAKDESQWYQYEHMLESIGIHEEHAILIDYVAGQLQSFLQKGSVSLICRTAGNWKLVMNSAYSVNAPHLGTIMHENSLANDALKSGTPQFAIHFNHTPRKISLTEPASTGATLAIPLLLHDRRQAVFLVNDENPLLFKESVKHKMTNLIRVVGLKMVAGKEAHRLDKDLFSNDIGALESNLMERVLHREIQRSTMMSDPNTWVCMFTFAEINSIRTRFGLEVLRNLQRQIIKRTSIETDQISAMTFFHADYTYFAVIQSSAENGLDHWVKQLDNKGPYQCQDDHEKLTFTHTAIKIDRSFKDATDLINKIKQSLTNLIRENRSTITSES